MESPRRLEANRTNAQLSNGPSDTSRTRLNALRHGVLSKETLIVVGDGQEDADAFEELGLTLPEDMAPVGALEELLVDELIMLTWRRRRVLRYENAAIRASSDTAIEDWEREEEYRLNYNLAGDGSWEATQDLANIAEELNEDLLALDQPDPLAVRPNIWVRVFPVALEQFHVSIRNVLKLSGPWDEYTGYSNDEIQRVVEAASQKAKISEDEFWQTVKSRVRIEYEQVARKWERRRWALERVRLSASLPDDLSLAKIQRYDAHLSRQFYKALHELQRLQAARYGLHPPAPVVLDVDIGVDPIG